MTQQLERDVRFLKAYAVVTTLVMVVGAATAFKKPATHEKFTEIDVERINVMEPDGKYRLVISNRPRSIGPIYKGKPFGYPGGGRPGLIFFNDEGTENGGLTFTGQVGADGKVRASTHMSFDQFNQDQVLNLDYGEDHGQRVVGISMLDRAAIDIHEMAGAIDSMRKIADTTARNAALKRYTAPRNGVPLQAQRVFVGRDPSRSAILNLSDPNGKSRLRLLVDSLGSARIEFLDANGKVTSTLGDTTKRQ